MEKAFFKRISSVIFSSDKTELDIGQKIYYKCLLASRKPEFYTKFEVADTFDGRFDMLCLIISVYMHKLTRDCLLYTSPSPRDLSTSRMPSSA